MTSDYPSKCRNYNFLETTKNEHITQTMAENKSIKKYVINDILPEVPY